MPLKHWPKTRSKRSRWRSSLTSAVRATEVKILDRERRDAPLHRLHQASDIRAMTPGSWRRAIRERKRRTFRSQRQRLQRLSQLHSIDVAVPIGDKRGRIQLIQAKTARSSSGASTPAMRCGDGRTPTTAVLAGLIWLPCVIFTLIRTSWRALPRGLTQTVIGRPVVRGNKFAISKRSSVSRAVFRTEIARFHDRPPVGGFRLWAIIPLTGVRRGGAETRGARTGAHPLRSLITRRVTAGSVLPDRGCATSRAKCPRPAAI